MHRVVVTTFFLFVMSAVLASAQPTPQPTNTWTHFNPDGTVDPGTTTPLPNGGTQTTYKNGWTHTVEPDNAGGPGALKVIDKDEKGRIRTISRFDGQKRLRHRTDVDYVNGKIVMTFTSYDTNGTMIERKQETTKQVGKTESRAEFLLPQARWVGAPRLQLGSTNEDSRKEVLAAMRSSEEKK